MIIPARMGAVGGACLVGSSLLGDVSKGKQVTIDNFYELFNGILNTKQIEGLRLLLTPFPQQQFRDRGPPKRAPQPRDKITRYDPDGTWRPVQGSPGPP
jgi:hypothetical protein